MKQALHNSLRRDNILRNNLIDQVSIYSKNYVFDPVYNLNTLLLFEKIDKAYLNKDKKAVIFLMKNFIENQDGVYTNEYGKFNLL